MITMSDTAQEHFAKLVEQQGIDGLGIRLRAVDPGTPKGDCGFSLYVDSASRPYLDGATIDFDRSPTGGQLTIKAPALRGSPPDENASIVERVRYVIETEINPQLAAHSGRVSLREVTAEGVVVLQFGGGCHGCGMVDATLRGGVERTLKERVPGVTGVADATDHETGENPYMRRRTATGT